jgi:hypothetical protein
MPGMAQRWITTAQAVKLTGYHPVHVQRLLRTGKIAARKFGPVWQVHRPSLLVYIRATRKAGRKRGPRPDAKRRRASP